MPARLAWEYPSGSSQVRIYRSTSQHDINKSANLVATVNSPTVQYDDADPDVTLAGLYYYIEPVNPNTVPDAKSKNLPLPANLLTDTAGIADATVRLNTIQACMSGHRLDFANNIFWAKGIRYVSFPAIPNASVVRNSVGTARTVAGAVTKFTANQPRRTDMGLLVESARTNYLLHSEDFTNAAWTKTDVTVGGDNIASPDGTINAELLTEGTAGNATVLQGPSGLTADATFAFSRFIKHSNTPWVKLWIGNGANQLHAWFNISTGAVGTSSVSGTAVLTSVSIEAFQNGWYRCVVVGSIGSGATQIDFHTFSASADNSNTRVNNAARYEWGTQIEEGTFATSYIPTTTVAVTRPADLISVTSLSMAWPMMLFCEFTRTRDTDQDEILAELTTSADLVTSELYVNDSDAHVLSFIEAVANSEVTGATVIGTSKAALRTATNSVRSARGGTLGTAVTTAASPGTTTKLFIGTEHDLSSSLNGYLKNLFVLPRLINDAGLQLHTA